MRIEVQNINLAGSFVVCTPGAKKVKERDTVTLVELGGHKVLGECIIHDVWVGDAAQAPAALLEIAQDPLMRTYSGMLVSMAMRAGADAGAPGAQVTLLLVSRKISNLVLPKRKEIVRP